MFVIYKIINNITYKIYIGQTVNFIKRKSDYKNAHKRKKHSMLIMRSIVKHGWKNFTMEIIDEAISLEELNDKEKYWISYYNSTDRRFGYNVRTGGENSRVSEMSKKKISETRILRGVAAGDNNPMYGKNHSIETRLKISEKAKARDTKGEKNHFYGKHHSNTSKNKMGGAVLDYSGDKNPNAKLNQIIADQIREEYKVIKSLKKLAIKYGVSKPTIRDIINNKRWLHS